MKTLKESILNRDELKMNIEVDAVMHSVARRYLERNSKCEYELKAHTMYIKTTGVPVLDEIFIKYMRQLKVNKVVWNFTGYKPKILGDWDMDMDIIGGSIDLCGGRISCNLNCDERICIRDSIIFKNAQIHCDGLTVFYGNLPEFIGNSKIYTPSISIRGQYRTDGDKLRNNLFLNELEKNGIISMSDWDYIYPNFNVDTDLTISKLCGKVFPDTKEISMTQIRGTGIYIGKNFKFADWGYGWNKIKLKDGNSLWMGNQK